MRPLLVVSLALAALVTGQLAAAAELGPGRTALRIAYWEDGNEPETKIVWTLTCKPTGGNHPSRTVACRRLAAGGRALFAPVPKNAVCTMISGGPQVARVVGILAGRRLWATFSRENGCQITRWNRLSPWLLPGGGVAA